MIFWLIGFLFVAGVLLGEDTFEQLDTGTKVFIVITALLIWPLYLGLMVIDKVEKFEGLLESVEDESK